MDIKEFILLLNKLLRNQDIIQDRNRQLGLDSFSFSVYASLGSLSDLIDEATGTPPNTDIYSPEHYGRNTLEILRTITSDLYNTFLGDTTLTSEQVDKIAAEFIKQLPTEQYERLTKNLSNLSVTSSDGGMPTFAAKPGTTMSPVEIAPPSLEDSQPTTNQPAATQQPTATQTQPPAAQTMTPTITQTQPVTAQTTSPTQPVVTTPTATPAAAQPTAGDTDIPKVKGRIGVRKNPDGSDSTHLMAREYLPGKGWVAFPTLFQDADGTWVDLSNQYKTNWESVYEEAVRRGEVYEFGEDQQAAINFADNGNWKNQLEQSNTTQQTANGLPQIQKNVTQSVAQLANPGDYIQKFLENELIIIHDATTPEEKLVARQENAEIQKLVGKDAYAEMKATLPSYLEQAGIVDGEAITNLKKEELSAKVKQIVPAIIVDAMKGVGAVAQIYGGLQRLSEITMPTPPEAPQPSPELQDALRLAQRDTQQIDPRLQEARKRAALQTLMQGREAAVTGSAGQAGAFAANMQQQLINVNQEMQQAALQDEQLRRQGMQTYGQLLSQKQAEDQFRKQYEMGVFDRNYREAVAQRTGAESLAATGFSNLQALGSNIATNIALAQYYKDLRDQLQPAKPMDTGTLEDIRRRRAAEQSMPQLPQLSQPIQSPPVMTPMPATVLPSTSSAILGGMNPQTMSGFLMGQQPLPTLSPQEPLPANPFASRF